MATALRVCISMGAFGLAFLLNACSDDISGPDAPTEPADVDAYFGSLPSWVEYSPPRADEDFVDPERSPFEQQGDMVCTDRRASLTRNPQEIVMFSPDAEIMWLGSLIQGRAHRDGLGSLLELPIRQRGPVDVSIDVLFSENTERVDNPDVASVGQAIGRLVNQAEVAGHTAGSSIYFNQVESHSFDQAVLSLGLSKSKLGRTVRLALETTITDSSSTLLASFTQKMFTTSLVLPQSPDDFFTEELTNEILQSQIDRGNLGPDNLPLYVSSITWGRMLLVEMTGSHNVVDLKAALHYTAQGDTISRTDSASVKYRRILDDSEIRVVAIGGHAQAAIDLIRTGRLGEYFKDDAPLTSARPLSYVLRNLGDNTIAKVSETTEYTIRECEVNGVKRVSNLTEWDAELQSHDLIRLDWPTTASNLALSEELTGPPGANAPMGARLTFLGSSTVLPFDFFLENRSALQIPDANIRAGLVYRDTEFPSHQGVNDRWISIGDMDGVEGTYVTELENDDFVVHIPRTESPVFAIGIEISDNQSTAGESITIRGEEDGSEFVFRFDEGIPTASFMGFIAPFPIFELYFDEDSGGDDIVVRDIRFGVTSGLAP